MADTSMPSVTNSGKCFYNFKTELKRATVEEC